MHLLRQLLLWLDGEAWHYWACAWFVLALVIGSALAACFRPSFWNRPWVFGLLVGLVLVAFRWPVIFQNRQLLNPDESQMISDAINLKLDPVYWRSADGNTVGPLVQWPLAFAARAGMRLDYTNARLFSTLLMWTMIVCSWLTLRRAFTDGLVRVLCLPLVAMQAMTSFWDFNQYSSEHVPVALISIATWLLATVLFPSVRANRPWIYTLAGLVLGAVPFAKLQGGPPAMVLGVLGLGFIAFAKEHSRKTRAMLGVRLVLGSLIIPLAIVLMVLAHRLWPVFWAAYIENNLVYANARWFGWDESLSWLYRMCYGAENFRSFSLPMTGLLLVGGAVYAIRGARTSRRLAGFLLALFAAAFYATMAPGRGFTHYLHFLMAPLCLLVAVFVGDLIVSWPGQTGMRQRMLSLRVGIILGLFLVITVAPQIWMRATSTVELLGQYTITQGKLNRRLVTHVLIHLAQPGDRLGLWGWEPSFFVEAGMPHAGLEANTSRQIENVPMRDELRQRYLTDFLRDPPPIFIDAVGGDNFCFKDRSQAAHEIFPALAKVIGDSYRLIADHEGTRVYLRRDRALTENARKIIAQFCSPVEGSERPL